MLATQSVGSYVQSCCACYARHAYPWRTKPARQAWHGHDCHSSEYFQRLSSPSVRTPEPPLLVLFVSHFKNWTHSSQHPMLVVGSGEQQIPTAFRLPQIHRAMTYDMACMFKVGQKRVYVAKLRVCNVALSPLSR